MRLTSQRLLEKAAGPCTRYDHLQQETPPALIGRVGLVAAAGNTDCVWTCWIAEAQIERVAPAEITGVTLDMDALANLADGAEASAKLMPLVDHYREWIEQRMAMATEISLHAIRATTVDTLLTNAGETAARMARGIDLLTQPNCLKAFRLANQAMAAAARQRAGPMQGISVAGVAPPCWRTFQLAFLLMNLEGLVTPTGAGKSDRKTVDLLFFPTGGGKTEAYLGLAAFTLVFRRLRHRGLTGAGVSVLMRYTLRLPTCDQLGRGATLICALELLREKDATLGAWPFEIGLWVDSATTPNQMGSKLHDHQHTARRRIMDFQNDDRKPSPIPLENCPWCGTRFKQASFKLTRNGTSDRNNPDNLLIACVNRNCDFNRDRNLPIVAVNEPLYRRLPGFIIATVDKFAAMPWTGRVGGLLGRVQRFNRAGFYGPMDRNVGAMLPGGGLPPPDLIIQDELHLISDPLGTMAGLYEVALFEELAGRAGIRPKIVASTGTLCRTESQIRALFDRTEVRIFPPPGPDRRDSFFARTLVPDPVMHDLELEHE